MSLRFLLIFFLFISSFASAQKITLEYLKKCKETVLSDYVDIPDSKIAYPVTGLVYLTQPSSLMGETLIQVEVWVIDAEGRIVYNTVYASKSLDKISFEPGYMKYMMSQGKAIIRKRRSAGF